MAVVARAEYSTGRHRAALAAAKASGHRLGTLVRQADGAEEQALMQIERDFVTAAQTRDIPFVERTLVKR